MPDLDPEELARFHHVLSNQFGFKLLEQGDTDPEHSLPAFLNEHVENGRHQVIRQETRENGHEPLRCEIVRRHLDFA